MYLAITLGVALLVAAAISAALGSDGVAGILATITFLAIGPYLAGLWIHLLERALAQLRGRAP